MSTGGFPEPRYPHFEKVSREDLKRRLRLWLSKNAVDSKSDRPRSNFFPTYGFGPGSNVLLVAATEYDSEVIHTYAEAFRELGARVDVLFHDLGSFDPEESAVQEASNLVVGIDNPCYTSFCNVISAEAAKGLVKANAYDTVVAGTAGPAPTHIGVKWGRTPYISAEEVASSLLDFPLELQIAIDRKVYGEIRSLVRARLVDPEGTDISWTNYDDGRAMLLSHELGKPCNIGRGGKPDCNGVVAGTLNHMGAFPHARAYVKDDLVVKVEGGGRYGDVWREKIEELNKQTLPPVPPVFTEEFLSHRPQEKHSFPGPGFFWFFEMGIGTMPGAFRLRREAEMRCYANFLHDRSRAGYVHNGFGAPSSATEDCTRANLPWTHVHIHSQFATLSGTDRDGSLVTVIDRGRLTALDDPEIIQLARRFGDPAELLSEAWVPAVPGINAKGSYEEYSHDPVAWIKSDAAKYEQIQLQ